MSNHIEKRTEIISNNNFMVDVIFVLKQKPILLVNIYHKILIKTFKHSKL